ncbi:MAG: hypothetical protein QXM68_00075 [Candidatus Aenigmatarchaeota archaeon]|nr:hypothetical protein [Candidatus Aenigmarchaeota archaeon]
MKGVSSVIATLLLVTITLGLIGVSYNFIRNISDTQTNNIEILEVLPDRVIISNNGNKPLSANDIKIIVDNQQYPVSGIDGGRIDAFKTGVVYVDLTSLTEGNHRIIVVGKSSSATLSFYHYPDDYSSFTPTTTPSQATTALVTTTSLPTTTQATTALVTTTSLPTTTQATTALVTTTTVITCASCGYSSSPSITCTYGVITVYCGTLRCYTCAAPPENEI